MSDLKEETTVNSTESTVEETVVENKKQVDPSLEGIQLFYEKNKRLINPIGGGLLAVVAAFCFFKFYYLPEQEKEALNEIYWAESLMEKDSFNLALKGGIMVNSPDGQKTMMGFEQIANDYSMTKTGNLANYYAGVCYMRSGKFEEAIDYLSKYSGNDEIVAAIAVGAIGDCNMELNRIDDAIKYYLKAADMRSNGFTTPLYLKKAGFAYEQKGEYAGALKAYERIKKEFSRSNEAREAEIAVARVKTLGNL